jgi:hypothetical protein
MTETATPKPQLREALDDLDEVFGAVFGHNAGDEPNLFADYDRAVEMQGKMRRAIATLRGAEHG